MSRTMGFAARNPYYRFNALMQFLNPSEVNNSPKSWR